MAEPLKLDGNLWGTLPPDILERVLASLPVRALCMFRSVSKGWNLLPSSPSFRYLRAQMHDKEPSILVLNGYKHCGVFDEGGNKWYGIDLLFLRPAFHILGCKRYRVEAADGGLLCVWSASANDKIKALVVCNPIARTWAYLPPMVMHISQPISVDMVVDANTFTFKLFVLGFQNHTATHPMFQIYDSCLKSWKLHSYPARPSHPIRPVSGALYNGIFYSLFYDIEDRNHVLMAHNVAEDTWMNVDIQLPRRLVTGQLLLADSRLFLVSPCKEVGGQATRYVLNLHISEIKFSTRECSRVMELPTSMFKFLFGNSHRVSLDSWITVGLRDSIIFVSHLGNAAVKGLSTDSDVWKPLLSYHFDKKGGRMLGSSFTPDPCVPVPERVQS